MEMKVVANILHEVTIDPRDVIQKLINVEIGADGWIFKEGRVCYRGYEESAGSHAIRRKEKISKQKFEYISSLLFVLKSLNQSKTNFL
jgi:hypothetical protein